MRFGKRDYTRVLASIFGRQHYRALANMLRYCPEFGTTFWRYIAGGGDYPVKVPIRTPLGRIAPTLHSYHDILTLNEIFFRLDYPADERLRVAVDVGSNIGISALYFLTRNPSAFCYLYEPVPQNLDRLRENLSAFRDRYCLGEVAVSDHSGMVEFGIEGTGRYGGIGVPTERTIQVQCVHINRVLEDVISRHGFIDILKIDTEGAELAILGAIDSSLAERIGRVYVEIAPIHPEAKRDVNPLGDRFRQRRYGWVWHFLRRDDDWRNGGAL